MISCKKSLKRKKYQRAVNNLVKKWNKNLKEDWLWDGRFVIHQQVAEFTPYEDHSGAEFWVYLTCTDTKTGKIEKRGFTNYDIESNIGRWVNSCIVDYFHVWNEVPGPYE